jgi:hypothetical protein
MKTREEIFREQAQSYTVCHSSTCPLKAHCLRHLLSPYVPEGQHVVMSVNLSNPLMQRDGCPQYRSDEPIRMPVGFKNLYYNMPGRIERDVKDYLIHTYSRKRYYEYRNGTRIIPPDVEHIIRATLRRFGWTEEPCFDGYIEEFLW